MGLQPDHEDLLTDARLTDEELADLRAEYDDLEHRLRDDGFSPSTIADVLRSLIHARTAPVDLQDAARSLRRTLPQSDLDGLLHEGEKHVDGKVHRSVRLVVYDRYLRGNDSRLRRYFRSRGVTDREVMLRAVLRALIRELKGQPVDEAAVLKAAGA